ncbi:hypothetical protein KR032_004929 [Drosophila birchii]|nr:hypothetical protein KR032_004929 [Drosophila birchii]
MDSNNSNSSSKKQPQSSSHHGKSSSGESQRKSSEVQANNTKQRNNRRREQLPTPRNEQQRTTRQQQQQQQTQQQQQPAKLRPNVDKRPRARGSSGYGANDPFASRGEDWAPGGTRLAYAGTSYPRGSGDFDHEMNSVYAQGSKKQNLNHLLNFHCVPRELERGHHHQHQHQHQQHHGLGLRKQRYNKEQFLQANFQFVVRSGAKAQVNGSPDTLIDWSYIEQINIQTTEELQCPICLYPPVAAKLTRCGHAYCWPCLLHYLSLSDKTWRKCPICYDAIHAGDLKSCTIEQRRDLQVGDTITFQLMRRHKGSMYIEKHGMARAGTGGDTIERFPLLSAGEEAKRYSKFLIAKRADVAAIIERERVELLAESDVSCPEDVFIQQALVMLQERGEKLGLEKPDPRDQLELEEVDPSALGVPCQDTEAKIDIEKPDDASISSVGEASSSASCSSSNNSNSAKYYYFYQSNDGQNIYLHPLNVKMLQACYGTLDLGPLLIEAQIVQMEQHSMDEEHRRKFTCLGHLPLTCQFSVVEVELHPPIVSGGILKLFREDLLHRKKERQRRDREERKREQHINEINDRQMGKLIASAANLNLSSSHEFPTCGFEEALPSPSGSLPMAISQDSGSRYSSVTLGTPSPKQDMWPTIGHSGSPGSAAGSLDFQVGAWGRSAPPPPPRAAVAPKQPSNEGDYEQRSAVGHWGLGELLVGALDQKKQKTGGGAAPAESKKQKRAKGKKMVPLFATGMNRAP